jgi:SAM-dependent methyltransferase
MIAKRASSFGRRAADYAEHRPGYPAEAVRWALEPVLAARPRVLDLAAGTGKLTAVIAALGVEVVAVEPDDAMRAELSARLPAVEALAGTAEDIPLPDGSVDAVLAGQAMHWFDHKRSMPELGRVLRPGGVLAGIWNDDDLSVDWVRELDRLHTATKIDTDNVPNKKGIDLPVELGPFGPLARAEFKHGQRRTAESLVATAETHSLFLTMAEPLRTQTLDRMLAYLKSRPETAEGEFDYPLRVEVLRAIRA